MKGREAKNSRRQRAMKRIEAQVAQYQDEIATVNSHLKNARIEKRSETAGELEVKAKFFQDKLTKSETVLANTRANLRG